MKEFIFEIKLSNNKKTYFDQNRFPMADIAVYEGICHLLETAGKSFKRVEHAPTLTSEESAKARGEDLSIGGKAILMRVDKSEHLFVLSASKKIDSRKVREHLRGKKTRFATAEELMTLCGLVPGKMNCFSNGLGVFLSNNRWTIIISFFSPVFHIYAHVHNHFECKYLLK